MSTHDQNEHDHDHDHDHGHEHPHDHPPAADHSDLAPDPEIALLEEAMRSLLIEKGIFTLKEIQRAIEVMASRDATIGARVVAKAWVDPEFKQALLTHGNSAVARLGVNMGFAELTVIENTPDNHNLVVCTLCSCYPRALLGIPPSWYKTKSYRARAVREPRAILAEFGLELDADQGVTVHDSTADLRFMVLPQRPAGTEGWSEEKLAELVSRDSLIGVARALDPAELGSDRRGAEDAHAL